ncbi:hypothetical protein F2P79_025476 [Pimephales promelas]|nr:hypothetical protein F2P79_025476 [Pimephales promelas]
MTWCSSGSTEIKLKDMWLKGERAHYPSAVAQYSWAGARWTEDSLAHAEADIKHMLYQLEMMTVTQELGVHNRCPKRFLGALLGPTTAVGTLFNIGMSSVNALNLATTICKTLRGTVVILNTHSVQLKQTVNSMKQLFTVFQNDFAQIQLVIALMTDMLWECIPLYVDPEQREMGFLLNLPIIESSRIYRLKDIVNVGFWKGNTHIKIRTPDVVAYHGSDP